MQTGIDRSARPPGDVATSAEAQAHTTHPAGTRSSASGFREQFVSVFEADFQRLYRFLDRLTGDADRAADLAQETFVRLYERGAWPDRPEAWLVTVAMNLLRNAQRSTGRRRALLTTARAEGVHSDPARPADEAVVEAELRRRVRTVLDRLPERDRHLLLLQAEGFSYRDMATTLSLNEASVGTLLARARGAFRKACEETGDAP